MAWPLSPLWHLRFGLRPGPCVQHALNRHVPQMVCERLLADVMPFVAGAVLRHYIIFRGGNGRPCACSHVVQVVYALRCCQVYLCCIDCVNGCMPQVNHAYYAIHAAMRERHNLHWGFLGRGLADGEDNQLLRGAPYCVQISVVDCQRAGCALLAKSSAVIDLVIDRAAFA